MTPVDATRTCEGSIPNNSAVARAVSSAVCIPSFPVQALAFPELTTMARQRPRLSTRFCRESKTGAAATRFVVKTPAAVVAGESEKISAKSNASRVFLIPAATAAPRNPGGRGQIPFDGLPLWYGSTHRPSSAP